MSRPLLLRLAVLTAVAAVAASSKIEITLPDGTKSVLENKDYITSKRIMTGSASQFIAPTVNLGENNKMPILGLGTWLERDRPEGLLEAIEFAIDSGYRHIDTASIYNTEEIVGQAVKNKIEDKTITREEIFITTKLWNNRHEKEQVVPELYRSLQKLGLEYVDLFLIHWPVSTDDLDQVTNLDFVPTWESMIEAKNIGFTKSIGVANFNITQLQMLMAASEYKPEVNQIEVNPNLQQNELVNFCNEHDIKVVAYSPLGYMSAKRATLPGAPAAPKIDDPVLTKIGKKYGKSPVQVVLRWLIQRGLTPIPKSVTPRRILENIDLFRFNLTQEDMHAVAQFDMNFRVVSPLMWKSSRYYPFELPGN